MFELFRSVQRQCGKGTRRLHGGPLVSTFYQFSTTQTKSRESQITCFARGILATTTTTFSRPPPSHPPSHNHLPPITSKADSLTYHVNSNAQHLRDRLCVTLYTLRNTDSDPKKKPLPLLQVRFVVQPHSRLKRERVGVPFSFTPPMPTAILSPNASGGICFTFPLGIICDTPQRPAPSPPNARRRGIHISCRRPPSSPQIQDGRRPFPSLQTRDGGGHQEALISTLLTAHSATPSSPQTRLEALYFLDSLCTYRNQDKFGYKVLNDGQESA